MNIRNLMIGSVAAMGLFATAANAATIVSLQLSETGFATSTVTGVGNSTIYAGSYGTFAVNLAAGTTGIAPDILNSTSLDTSTGGAGVLTVAVTATGLTAPVGTVNLRSSFTDQILPAGWTVTEATYYDGSDTAFATTSALSSASFNTIGTMVDYANATLAAPYSVTEVYTISAGALGGTSSATIDLATAVPEPATWAMFLVGFGAIGFGMRSARRAKAVTA